MIGFYAIRKLIEAHRISDDLRDRQLPLQSYPWTGSAVTFLNWDKVDQKYDLEQPVPVTQPVRWIANQLIHSFVFLPCFDSDARLDSVLFNSDRTRRQHLYRMWVDDIITLFGEVAVNDPASMRSRFNQQTGDCSVWGGPTMERDEAAYRL